MLESSTKEVLLDIFFSIIWLLKMGIFIVNRRLISLACVSSETYNLQRLKRCVFLTVLVWNRVSISTIMVWNRVWFVHSSLELGYFLELVTSSSFGDKTISPLMFMPTTVYVP